MAEIVEMPLLSDTMEEGTIAKWLVKEGDKVEEGDILAEIESDKATLEFESFHDGTVLKLIVQEGETALINKPIAIIGDEGEDVSDLLAETENGDSEKEEESEEKERSENEEKQDSQDEEQEEQEAPSQEIPDGVEVIEMPLLSDTMEEGTIANWIKKEGDDVEEGDILAEIESDKATLEFESFYEGTLLKIIIDEGESAGINKPIAIIGPEGTDVSGVLETYKSGDDKKTEDKKTSEQKKETDKKKEESSTPAIKEEEKSSRKDGERIFASPLAKRMAEDKGIDLADVEGTGDRGRIIKRDIENYKPVEKPKEAEAPQTAEVYTPAGEESFETVKNSQMRKTIAKRLTASQFGAPHYYLTIEVDMENAMSSRKSINAMPDTKISFNDMVIKASAMALRKHPQVNSQWTDEAMKIAKHIHIGFAVAVEEGLVVPVLRFADQQALTQINANVRELAGKAHNKKIQPAEMEGSTFTVSNLGMFGIQEFTSIINQPNSCILSVGTIVEKPVVKDGQIVVGNTMKLTLACDHRTVDGATGAKFLQTLKTYLENPVTMLA